MYVVVLEIKKYLAVQYVTLRYLTSPYSHQEFEVRSRLVPVLVFVLVPVLVPVPVSVLALVLVLVPVRHTEHT